MDFFALCYYAIICGLLTYGAPLLETSFRRLLLGLCTGLIAVTAMPFIRELFM